MTHAVQKSFLLPAILWIVAFLCALDPVNTYQLEFLVGGIVLMFVWSFTMLARRVDEGWSVPKKSFLFLIAGLFWGLILCSVFWSEVKPLTLSSVCLFSVMPLTFYCGVMGGDVSYFKKMIVPLAAIFTVLGIWAIFQFFFLNAYFQGQAHHPLADPSSLGGLLSLPLFCAIGWIVSERPRRERIIATVLAMILIGGIMSTVARGPVFAFVPGIVLFAILLWPRVKRAWKSLLVLVLFAVAFQGVMSTNVQKTFDLAQRVSGTVTAVEEGGIKERRTEVWTSTLQMIKDAPLIGRGFGTYFLYYPEYRLPTEKDGVYYAHNDPLQFWVELGILGPVLFYAFAVAAAVRTFRSLKNLAPNNPDRLAIVSLFAALAAMVAHAHISFSHYNISILMVVGLMLAIWFVLTGKALAEEQKIVGLPESMPRNMNKALLALPFLMTGWLYVSIMGGEYFVNKARDALFVQDMQSFMENINKAGSVSLGLNYRAYLFAVNVPMAILDDRKATMDDAQKKKLYEQVEGYMDNILALNPRVASAYYYMAKVQSLVPASVLPEDLAPPEELYERALELDPMHLGARLELLTLYGKDGRSLEERIAFMEKGYHFRYGTTQAQDYYDALAKLYLEAGNYGKMKDVLAIRASFSRRSQISYQRQNMSIPQAVMGGNDTLPAWQ